MTTNHKTRFNDIGFLSDESTTNSLAQQLTSSECYKICIELNKLAQSVLNHTPVHPDDRKEVYATLYFQRMLSHYQAILIMAEHCMVHQVEILLRALLEILFDLVAFHKHDDFFEVLILGDSNQRLEFLKTIREQQKVAASYTKEELNELEKMIVSAEDIDRNDFKVYMKADLAGMLNDYRTTYSLLSEAVHSSIHSLETDLIVNPLNNEIEGINSYGQKLEDIFSLLMTTANYMIIGINMIVEIVPAANNKTNLELINKKIQDEWLNRVSAVYHR
jgi:hypothetical protein